MNVEIKIPGVGESITEGTLALWSVADGSVVIEGQAIFELETDKTTIDVTAPATGTLSITVAEGTDVEIDQVVGMVDTDKAETIAIDSAPVVEAHSPVPSGGRITPSAKAEAAVKDIDTATLTGSGRNGMVTRSDVKEESDEPQQGSAKIEIRKTGEYRKPLSRIRKIIAANLRKTQSELVLLTTFNEVNMSAVKALRKGFGEDFREKHGVKLGFMSFFIKASASALESYPDINARIDGDEVIYSEGIHISVAVSTPKGLVTPVVRSVENLSFADIERQIVGFSKKAAEKKLLPEDLMGGSFTITNGGIFGSMLSTPLPAPGQSAILGMHAIQDRPAVLNGEVVIRPMMYLALSYDHRLVDGREAVGFLKTIKDTLENPERLLLEL